MTFWDALKQSVVISGIISLGLLGTIIYLAVVGQEIPTILTEGFTLVLGFHFGSKVQAVATARSG